jgi:hypothetical protein
MTLDPKNTLANELAEMRIADDQDFLEWLPLAARLRALGDDSQLVLWHGKFKELDLDERLEVILNERAIEGVEELHESSGEDLAYAITAAQDFYCFLDSEREILSERTQLSLEAWALETSDVELDREAAERLEHWLRIFPIEESLRLPIVHAPLSAVERAFLAALAPSVETFEASWPAQAEPEMRVLEHDLVQLDDGEPPAAFREAWRRVCEHAFDDGLGVEVARSLNERWEVAIDVNAEIAAEVELVRLGLLVGVRDESDPSRWVVDLSAMKRAEREKALGAPLVLRLSDSRRLILS